MFARRRFQRYFMKILRLCFVRSVQMPEDSCLGVAVRQFHGYESAASVHLFGEFDTGIGRRIYKLHRLEEIFSAAGFERRQGLVLGVVLFVVPFPYRRESEP